MSQDRSITVDETTLTTSSHVGGNQWWRLDLARKGDVFAGVSVQSLAEARAIAALIDGSVREYECALVAQATRGHTPA